MMERWSQIIFQNSLRSKGQDNLDSTWFSGSDQSEFLSITRFSRPPGRLLLSFSLFFFAFFDIIIEFYLPTSSSPYPFIGRRLHAASASVAPLVATGHQPHKMLKSPKIPGRLRLRLRLMLRPGVVVGDFHVNKLYSVLPYKTRPRLVDPANRRLLLESRIIIIHLSRADTIILSIFTRHRPFCV